jgi:predicted DNA-binding transcriptional regulator YafY
MPVNKNALARYGWLDDCLRRRQRHWTIEDLMAAISEKMAEFGIGNEKGISKRQVQEDIKNMRPGGITGYEAPIECDRDTGSYSYSDPAYSIRNSPLVSDDAAVLQQVLGLLHQFEGLGLGDELHELAQRVEAHLQAQAATEPARQLIWFEQVPAYAGAHWLGPLYRAMRRRQVLALRYRPFGAAEAWETIVQPYLLKQYNHRWFLVGQGTGRPGLSTYALDRIEAVQPNTTLLYLPPPADLAARFADVVGASAPAEGSVPELVQLRFGAGRGQYVRTKPLHPSQQILLDTAEALEISLCVVPTLELETLLLSFGEDMEVLAPLSLREQLGRRLRVAAKTYTD